MPPDLARILRTGLLALAAGVIGFYLGLFLVLELGGLEAAGAVPATGLGVGGLLAGVAAGLSERVASRLLFGLAVAGLVFGVALGGLVAMIEADIGGAAIAGLLLITALVRAARSGMRTPGV